jgi:hypothetical protein
MDGSFSVLTVADAFGCTLGAYEMKTDDERRNTKRAAIFAFHFVKVSVLFPRVAAAG